MTRRMEREPMLKRIRERVVDALGAEPFGFELVKRASVPSRCVPPGAV